MLRKVGIATAVCTFSQPTTLNLTITFFPSIKWVDVCSKSTKAKALLVFQKNCCCKISITLKTPANGRTDGANFCYGRFRHLLITCGCSACKCCSVWRYYACAISAAIPDLVSPRAVQSW